MIGLILALVVFGFGTFGVGCLLMVTWFLRRRVRDTDAPLLADVITVNICAGVCLLIECATLVWDNLSRNQFPHLIRWGILIILVPVMTRAALRLLEYYLDAAKTANTK